MRSLFCIALLVNLVLPVHGEADPVDVSSLPQGVKRVEIFLLMGQSNMKGRGKIPAKQTPHPRIVHMNMENDQWYPAIHPLHRANAPDKPKGKDNSGVGPGLAFARELIRRDEKLLVALVPTAKGGSGMNLWKPNGKLYKPAVAKARKALGDFPKGTARIAGALWLQGESDSRRNLHPSYAKVLDAMVVQLRVDLDAPKLPFIACTIGAFIKPEKFPDVAQINTHLLGLPDRVPHTACVDARDLIDGHIGDFVHYNTAAQETIGKRYAAEYLRLVSRP